MSRPISTFENVSVKYQQTTALHDISGRIESGNLTCILGPNGGGKTTFLKALLGFEKVATGKIINHFTASDMAYMPQKSGIDTQFPLSVYDVVAYGAFLKTGLFGRLSHSERSKIDQALKRTGLLDCKSNPIKSLSVGQFQRMLFARTIVQDKTLLIFDEPFAAIDAKTVIDMMDILQQWSREGRTILAVIHDFDLALRCFPTAIYLDKTCTAWGNTQDILEDLRLQANGSQFRNL